MLKSDTGRDLISHSLLAGPEVYCVQTHNEDIKQVCEERPTYYVNENFNVSDYGDSMESSLVPRSEILTIYSLKFKTTELEQKECHPKFINVMVV